MHTANRLINDVPGRIPTRVGDVIHRDYIVHVGTGVPAQAFPRVGKTPSTRYLAVESQIE